MVEMLMTDDPVINLLFGKLFGDSFFDKTLLHPLWVPAGIQQQSLDRTIQQFGLDIGSKAAAVTAVESTGNALVGPWNDILVDQQSPRFFHVVQQNTVFEPAGFRYDFHLEALDLTDIGLIQFLSRHHLFIHRRRRQARGSEIPGGYAETCALDKGAP